MSDGSTGSIQFQCPKCSGKLSVPAAQAGASVTCPKCEATIKTPRIATLDREEEWIQLDQPAVQIGIEPPKPTDTTRYRWQKNERTEPPKGKGPATTRPHTAAPTTTGDSPAPKQSSGTSRQGQTASVASPQGTASRSGATKPPSSPPSAISPDASDDDLQLAPEEPPRKSRESAEQLLQSASSPSPKPSTKKTVPQPPPREESQEYRVQCKLCGTLMYAEPQQAGRMIQCPDCHSQFEAPPPPVKRAAKPAKPAVAADPMEVRFKNETPPVRPTSTGTKTTQDILDRAKQELEDAPEDGGEANYDFDTRGWLMRSFSFLFDPGLILIAIASGVFSAGLLLAVWWFAQQSEATRGLGSLLGILIGAGLGIPLMSALLTNGLAVLESSANRLKRVQEWPMFNPVEWFGEITCVVVAFLMAALPGSLLALLVQYFGGGKVMMLGAYLISVWLFFPPLLLSMLDLQSFFRPYSKEVYQSFQSRGEAWGACYMMTALGLATFYLLSIMIASMGWKYPVILGMALPWILFYLFQQYGVLASRISDVTNLGFEPSEAVAEESSQTELPPQ
ncbi:MAG: hypothetical protein ACK56G_13930 [Pirellulaceae bacterium]